MRKTYISVTGVKAGILEELPDGKYQFIYFDDYHGAPVSLTMPLTKKTYDFTESQAYDLLNSTIAQKTPKEEMALPLNGKKNNLTKRDFLTYFANEKLGLNQKVIDGIIQEFHQIIPQWRKLIGLSFLSQQMQENYLQLLDERSERLNIF